MNTIQVANLQDLPLILNLQKKVFGEIAVKMNKFDIPPLMETIEEVEKQFENNIFLKYLSKDGQIVGSVRGALSPENTCGIGKLIVDPNFQNKGIGRALMLQIESYFPHCSKFTLFTSSFTPNTIHLYQKIGYHIIDTKELDGMIMTFMEKQNMQPSSDHML